MQTQAQVAQIRGLDKKSKNVLSVSIPVQAYCDVPVPGFKGASMGVCFVKVTDLPVELEDYMEINPRAPKRTASGSLTGPVVKDIMQTLREEPEEMALKNRGLFILAENVLHKDGSLKFVLSNKGTHGVCDGGHTMACIMEARETAETDAEKYNIENAYVRVHVVQGLKADQVVEIASGLNTSRAVDDASLMNLQGDFDFLRRILRDTPAADNISYSQGDTGSVYVSELLVFLSALNPERYTQEQQPAGLYNRKSLAIKYFAEDLRESPRKLQARIELLPQMLELIDEIKLAIPEAAKKAGWKIGMSKIGGGERMGSAAQRGKPLPFTGKVTNYKIPAAWVLPIFSAFRVALKPTKEGYVWRANPKLILKDVIGDLVNILIAAHKAAAGHVDKIGKSEATYSACASKVELWLARKRML